MQGLALLDHAHGDAQAKLCVVLKQRVGPCRPKALGVGGVGVGGVGASPNGGAASGIGDDQALAEQLRQQLDIGRLATALTSTYRQGGERERGERE